MRYAKIVKVIAPCGVPMYEVHAPQSEEYKGRPSYEYLGPGYHREVTLGTLAHAVAYCANRGLVLPA